MEENSRHSTYKKARTVWVRAFRKLAQFEAEVAEARIALANAHIAFIDARDAMDRAHIEIQEGNDAQA